MVFKVNRFALLDYEKEEEWFNEMAAKGYNFVDNFIFRYLFEMGTPGEYIYRIEYLPKRASSMESLDYFAFLKENGVECVSTNGRWAYFRKKAVDGPFQLYSDYSAKIRHYKRYLSFLFFIIFANIALAGLNLVIFIKFRQATHLSLFLSNGLITVFLLKIIVSYWKKIKTMNAEKAIHE